MRSGTSGQKTRGHEQRPPKEGKSSLTTLGRLRQVLLSKRLPLGAAAVVARAAALHTWGRRRRVRGSRSVVAVAALQARQTQASLASHLRPREASLPKVAQHEHAPALDLLLAVVDLGCCWLCGEGGRGGGRGMCEAGPARTRAFLAHSTAERQRGQNAAQECSAQPTMALSDSMLERVCRAVEAGAERRA